LNENRKLKELAMEFRYDPQSRRLRMRALVPAGHHAEKFVAAEDFKFGIEEEYFLSDAHTFEVPAETPDALFETADFGVSGRIEREFLQAQIEVATEPQFGAGEARAALLRLRQNAAAAAAEHGYVVLACGTHPLAHWRHSVQSPKARYSQVMDALQMIGQRDMLCGMHVHVEFPDPQRRIDVMTRIIPYLPLFIALSASSPFWQGRATGLKAYRLAAYDELPRTGFPDLFRNQEEYDSYVSAMERSGAMPDASHLWWSIRPSLKYPTLELRAPDCCTRIDDTIGLVALYRSLIRYLYGHPEHYAEIDNVDRAIAVENKWRAQRYGVQGTFVTRSGAVSVADMLGQVLAMIGADGDALDCTEQLEHCRSIVLEGTSADAQLRIFTESEHEGADIALHKVIEWVRDATLVA
jgi:glutamate---cysteine ligase / carboxylate-amine ligase